MRDDCETRVRDTWLRARQELGGDITALEFGDADSGVASGGQCEPSRLIRLPLGPGALAREYLRAARPGEAAIEAAIAEVEQRIMPLRALVAHDSQCVSGDRNVARIARVLGSARGPWVALTTETVEDGFNRWVSIALGRPPTQDTLPTDPEFAASLLVLREWLHHLSFAQVRVEQPGSHA